jgi:ABC-type uncharacterized transport system substrate-binding protein
VRRRHFLTLAGAAAAFPRIGFAQQAKLPRVAFVRGDVTDLPANLNENSTNPQIAAFFTELARLGFAEGRTVTFDRYNAVPSNAQEVAAKVVASGPDLIIPAGAVATALALIPLTKSIPIVSIGGDPLGLGIVTNLAHPGGNVTAIAAVASADSEGKTTSILAEAIPTARRIAYITQGSNGVPNDVLQADVRSAVDAAAKLGLSIVVVVAENPAGEPELLDAFVRAIAAKIDAVQIARATVFNDKAPLLAKWALDAKMPTISPYILFTQSDGLLSYGSNLIDVYRQSAGYVAMILNGAKPGDLPVLQPTLFDLIVNLTTAKALGLIIPASILAQATQVIQ